MEGARCVVEAAAAAAAAAAAVYCYPFRPNECKVLMLTAAN